MLIPGLNRAFDKNLSVMDETARRMERTDKGTRWMGERRRMQVNGRGYTHSIVAGVAFRKPSCQFSTGTGMQVSLMVSWQRRDRGWPLSSSSWALLWTVSTTEGGGGGRGGRGGGGRGQGWGFQEVESGGVQMWGTGGREEKEDREDTKTYEARTTERKTRKQSQALSWAHLLKLLHTDLLSHQTVLDASCQNIYDRI